MSRRKLAAAGAGILAAGVIAGGINVFVGSDVIPGGADSTPPTTSITTPPSDGTSTSASIPFTGADNVGVDHFECRIDSGSWSTCTSPKTYSGLSVASHTFDVRAYDAAGNFDATPATATWPISSAGSGPTNTVLPVVAGVTDTGSFVAPQLFAKTAGTWTGGPVTQYRYQWQDCNSAGRNCANAPGVAYGPGATASRCVSTTTANGCQYNLLAGEATAPCPYASGGAGACKVRLVVTATSAAGSTDAATTPIGPVAATTSPAWPNYSNTGYQNAPGYPGTPGVADVSNLTVASAGSGTCPTTFQSNQTYSFCRYPVDSQFVGSSGGHLTNVHFIGSLFEYEDVNSNPAAIEMYCDSNCTFDYITLKPADLDAPDLPGHGITYAKGYSAIMGAGWGAFNSYGRGVSLKHSDIWGWASGIILGANTSATPNLFQDNWLHDQADCLNDQSCLTHADGIGMVDTDGTSSYQTIDHNNMPFILNNTNNIAFQQGTYDHLTITNNILSGDGYTVAIWSTSSNVAFTGNRWTNYGQQLYGPVYPQSFYTVGSNTWDNNRFLWDPTGASPFYFDGPGNGNENPITSADDNKCWVPTGTGISTTDYGGGTC